MEEKPLVFIVDDDPVLLDVLDAALADDFRRASFTAGEACLTRLAAKMRHGRF